MKLIINCVTVVLCLVSVLFVAIVNPSVISSDWNDGEEKG